MTLVPTHIEKTNQVVMKNRRIGTSQTGIVENFGKDWETNIFVGVTKDISVLKNWIKSILTGYAL